MLLGYRSFQWIHIIDNLFEHIANGLVIVLAIPLVHSGVTIGSHFGGWSFPKSILDGGSPLWSKPRVDIQANLYLKTHIRSCDSCFPFEIQPRVYLDKSCINCGFAFWIYEPFCRYFQMSHWCRGRSEHQLWRFFLRRRWEKPFWGVLGGRLALEIVRAWIGFMVNQPCDGSYGRFTIFRGGLEISHLLRRLHSESWTMSSELGSPFFQ